MKNWLIAARPRTLPLALSSIGMGAFLAAGQGKFSLSIFSLLALTTVLLQVLSNFANDYGDFIHGADSDQRKGPSRLVQSGIISAQAMKRAMIITGIIALISGIGLIYLAFGGLSLTFFLFMILGLLAIWAAISYTAGEKPYGYVGLGDISVFIFFGLVGVCGSYYLFTGQFLWMNLLPAISCGVFSVGVLNLNNIRDIESDLLAGKRSIPIRLGRKLAVNYHGILLLFGIIASLAFQILNQANIQGYLFLLVLPLLAINFKAVRSKTKPQDLDPYLKQLALSTLLFVILFGLSQLT
jgi:1,4-dihydroxy-2-naphthoate octaprenyltransferase